MGIMVYYENSIIESIPGKLNYFLFPKTTLLKLIPIRVDVVMIVVS